MLYYHATTEDHYSQILDDFVIKRGCDGSVYLADSVQNAVKFIALRSFNKDIYIFEIEVPDESKIVESFDHSEAFFKCRAWTYPEDIDLSYVTNIYKSSPNK